MAVLLALLAAAPARGPAVAAEQPGALRYQIEVAGVQVGDVDVRAEAGEDAAQARVRWRIDGLLGLMDRERGRLEGRGRVEAGRVEPESFEAAYEKSDRRREAAITYGPDGSIRELELRRDGRRRGSEVPEDLRAGTVDTITALWRLRDWLAAGGEEAASLPVFDGRRRYDLQARRLGRQEAELHGRDVQAWRVELTLVPISGFEDDEKLFGNRIDPDRPWAELLVVDGGGRGDEPVPLSLVGQGRLKWRIVLDDDRRASAAPP